MKANHPCKTLIFGICDNSIKKYTRETLVAASDPAGFLQ